MCSRGCAPSEAVRNDQRTEQWQNATATFIRVQLGDRAQSGAVFGGGLWESQWTAESSFRAILHLGAIEAKILIFLKPHSSKSQNTMQAFISPRKSRAITRAQYWISNNPAAMKNRGNDLNNQPQGSHKGLSDHSVSLALIMDPCWNLWWRKPNPFRPTVSLACSSKCLSQRLPWKRVLRARLRLVPVYAKALRYW